MATTAPSRWGFGEVNRVAPTRAGAVYLALVGGVLFGAVNTGNNLVYLVLGVLLAALVVANVLAEWNLRSLSVERRLPAELRAGIPASGGLILRNGRGRGAAWQVELIERGDVAARARVERCPPGEACEAPAEFLAAARGAATLSFVRIQSDFPFGMVRRWRDVALTDEVLVYPAASVRPVPPAPQGDGEDAAARGRPSATGDFAGLRPWRPGDPLRRVHWPTTARVGEPMVVNRSAQGVEELMLRLDPALRGEAREAAIERVAGRAEEQLAQGNAVGIEVDGQSLPPRTGAVWRRRLLTAMALLEHR